MVKPQSDVGLQSIYECIAYNEKFIVKTDFKEYQTCKHIKFSLTRDDEVFDTASNKIFHFNLKTIFVEEFFSIYNQYRARKRARGPFIFSRIDIYWCECISVVAFYLPLSIISFWCWFYYGSKALVIIRIFGSLEGNTRFSC